MTGSETSVPALATPDHLTIKGTRTPPRRDSLCRHAEVVGESLTPPLSEVKIISVLSARSSSSRVLTTTPTAIDALDHGGVYGIGVLVSFFFFRYLAARSALGIIGVWTA